MGLFDPHQGSWSIGGYNLPDFGVTELLTGNRTAQGGSNLFGSANAPSQASGLPTNLSNYTFGVQPSVNPTSVLNQNGSVLGSSTGGSTGVTRTSQPTQNTQTNTFSAPTAPQGGQGYDQYIQSLNDQLNALGGQNTALINQANSAYDTGSAQLATTRDQQVADTNKQQANSLKDLASNVQNLFQAGNTYLGARGAGDSSAANQYSYAISKMGSKERAGIVSQAQDRLNQINDTYTTGLKQLDLEKQNQLASIAQWFTDAQNQIKGSIGQAGLAKGQDIQRLSENVYNQAISAMQQVASENANRRAALESWAAGNAKTVGELVSNLQNVQALPAFQGIQNGLPQVNSQGGYGTAPIGFGATDNTQKDIFGNPIQ